jgi:hypothetical protein
VTGRDVGGTFLHWTLLLSARALDVGTFGGQRHGQPALAQLLHGAPRGPDSDLVFSGQVTLTGQPRTRCEVSGLDSGFQVVSHTCVQVCRLALLRVERRDAGHTITIERP